MHFRRWLVVLVIALMLIDSWVTRAGAMSSEPGRSERDCPTGVISRDAGTGVAR